MIRRTLKYYRQLSPEHRDKLDQYRLQTAAATPAQP